MAGMGKNIKSAKQQVETDRQHEIPEAVALMKKVKYAKFDESVDMDIRLGVDPRAADQQVRGSITLPFGTGKTVRVAVFAQGEQVAEAEAAGADIVGGEDLAKRIQEGFLDFDKCVSSPDMMRVVGRLGKVLGPRGLMPNPKAGTVTKNIAQAIRDLKSGQVEYRVDRYGIVHNSVGRTSMSDEALIGNVTALLQALIKARPAAAKGLYIRNVTLSSSMGPGIALNPAL